MTDHRPENCRFRLRDEGKPYPRSSCRACGRTITTGLGKSCSTEASRIEALEEELRETQDRANAFAAKEYYTEIRAEKAEAERDALAEKLERAVEALTFYGSHENWVSKEPYVEAVIDCDEGSMARDTLSALEEKKNGR